MLDRARRAASRRRLPLLALPIALGACASAPVVQTTTAPRPAAYVVRLGSDTVAAEQFVRTATGVEGDILVRAQAPGQSTVIQHYVITLGPDGRPARLVASVRRPDGTLLPGYSATLQFGADTVTRDIMRDTLVRQRIAARGALPHLGNPMSAAVAELVLAHVRATGRDSADVPLVGTAARATPWPVKLLGGDSARIWYYGDPQRVRVNGQGHLLSLDATHTTNKVVITPVSSVDLMGLANDFTAREGRGVWIGTTRDTVRAQVGGAALWVDYGRPLARGRTLFGTDGVLGDTLWRTGANAATQLRTDRDLVIGGQAVPAGTYTLFTHARNGRYELIINRQTGQWGTDYNPAQDLGRVPLTESRLPTPVERFTVAVEPQGGSAGTLALQWGTTRLSVPFTVR